VYFSVNSVFASNLKLGIAICLFGFRAERLPPQLF
jgi:hypothetical protein